MFGLTLRMFGLTLRMFGLTDPPLAQQWRGFQRVPCSSFLYFFPLEKTFSYSYGRLSVDKRDDSAKHGSSPTFILSQLCGESRLKRARKRARLPSGRRSSSLRPAFGRLTPKMPRQSREAGRFKPLRGCAPKTAKAGR